MRRHAWRLLWSLVLFAGFWWVLRRSGLPYMPPKGTLDRVDPVLLSGFVICLLLQTLVRHFRYHFLIAPVASIPIRRIMTINMIAVAFITFLPFRLGEAARPAMLREKGHLSAWAIMGTVAAERIIDGIVFSGMLLLGLAVARPQEPIPDRIGTLSISPALVPRIGLLAGLGFGAAFLVMAAFYFFRTLARRVTESVIGIVSKPLARRVADAVGRVSDGLRFLVHVRQTVPYVLVTVAAALAHAWAIQLLADAVGLPALSLGQAMVVVGVLALGFAAPNAPGFFGSVQLALYASLAVYVPPEKVTHEGAAMVFLFYVTYLGLVVLLAALASFVEFSRGGDPVASRTGS